MAVRKGRAWAPAGLLAGALLLFGAGAGRPAFSDLSGHWAQSPILALSARGILKGFPDGRFQPLAPVTRAQAARLLAAAVGAERDAQRLAGVPSRFADLAGHWAQGYVEAAAERNLIQGYEDATYRPERPVRRDEAILLVARAAGLSARARQMPPAAALPFADAAEIPAWARAEIWAAAGEGLLQDLFPDRLQPERPISRAELAALTARLLARRGGLHHLSGVVESWDGDRSLLQVRTAAGARQQIPVPPDALVFRSGLPARQFRPLDQVWAVLGPGGEALYVEARYLDLTGQAAELHGRVLTVMMPGTWTWRRVTLAADARVFVNGRPAPAADLHGANRVYAVLDASTGEARLVDAVRYTHYGTLVGTRSVQGKVSLTLRLGNGALVTLPVAPDAIAFDHGARIRPEALAAGPRLMVWAPAGGPATYLEVDL